MINHIVKEVRCPADNAFIVQRHHEVIDIGAVLIRQIFRQGNLDWPCGLSFQLRAFKVFADLFKFLQQLIFGEATLDRSQQASPFLFEASDGFVLHALDIFGIVLVSTPFAQERCLE
ncbi:hypothetical protein [Pseudotabrizicola formosa]|uniref:hypothetical protein n=1 Tax=Pseudotabrizicola formosa TaxID=2030009 RepID=UPI001FEDE2CA|nr:hypothetical protein [Pseudotabrizicola formosa]